MWFDYVDWIGYQCLQDRIRQYHRELIRLAGGLVSTPRLVEYLMQGLASKNNRSRVDCVDLLGELLEESGLATCARSKLKPVAAMAQVRHLRSKWPAFNGWDVKLTGWHYGSETFNGFHRLPCPANLF